MHQQMMVGRKLEINRLQLVENSEVDCQIREQLRSQI